VIFKESEMSTVTTASLVLLGVMTVLYLMRRHNRLKSEDYD
jgi:hypothetical protein